MASAVATGLDFSKEAFDPSADITAIAAPEASSNCRLYQDRPTTKLMVSAPGDFPRLIEPDNSQIGIDQHKAHIRAND